ncbi:MAG: UpxY family transcription antiterminator [Dysgonamonadaceae bacterium]|jgi:transcription antitermination factor NusG|nr:UpxY family transcription antiterminator [Dysgonamonadaceae bacterium]
MKQSIAQWYVAKVRYRTEKKIKNYLEKEGIEHYIPFRDEKPVIPCTVFIRTDYERALSLPEECGCTIDYLYNPDTKKFRIIPGKQLTDFMFLQEFSDKTILLTHPEDLSGGEKVRVIKGEFAGIEGELYRIKGHRRVVVRLEGLASLALGNYIAKECLERII